ncbi:hypothetical protein D3C85_1549300 [compost metagenome]
MAATCAPGVLRDLLLQPVLLLWAALYQCLASLFDRCAEPGRDWLRLVVTVQGTLEQGESLWHRDLYCRSERGDCQS